MIYDFSLKNPKLGKNFLAFASLSYQLLYFKLGNKRMAINEHRDRGHYPSGFYKFEINKKQKEYLEIISLGRKSKSVLNIPDELRNELRSMGMDFTIYDNLSNMFKYVKNQVSKMSKAPKDAMNTFVNDERLFLNYFDFIMNNFQISPV